MHRSGHAEVRVGSVAALVRLIERMPPRPTLSSGDQLGAACQTKVI
jgi:hypothetical protein